VTGCTQRRNYYVYTGVPNVCIDGLYVNVNDSYYWYRLRFNERKQVDSPLVMDLRLEDYDNDTGVGHVRTTITNVSDDYLSASLRYVATGDDTVGTWGGFNHLSNTALHIFPSATGIATNIRAGETIESIDMFQIPLSWRHKPCTIVAFMQNDVDREVYQAAILHEVILGLSGEASGGQLVLSWPAVSQANAYHIHGISGMQYFKPTPENRLVVLPAGTTTWSTTTGIGDPEAHWTYIAIAVDGSGDELTRSLRLGEYEYECCFP